MRVLIIDDEAPAREELAWLLEQCEAPPQVVAVAPDAAAAREVVEGADPPIDLVFLDMDMPGLTGMRLAQLWFDQGKSPMIVFVTAHQEYGAQAFEVDAVDYLLKPVRLGRLERALAKARALQASETQAPEGSAEESERAPLTRISVQDRGVYRVIPTSDILFFEAEDGVVVIQTREARFMCDFQLKFLEQNLDPQVFFRSHRSYIVRLGAIDSIAPWGAGTFRLVLDRDAEIDVPLARSRAPELKALIPWSASVFEDG